MPPIKPMTGLEGGVNYDYLASSGSESGAVFNQVSGKFRTELVIPTLAVLLNKSSSIWQLRVTLTNQGAATATNVVIDGMVLNATNTTTRLPVVTPAIVGGSSKDLIFTYNRMRLLGVLNARITGTYTTPKGVIIRFSKVLPVQIL